MAAVGESMTVVDGIQRRQRSREGFEEEKLDNGKIRRQTNGARGNSHLQTRRGHPCVAIGVVHLAEIPLCL